MLQIEFLYYLRFVLVEDLCDLTGTHGTTTFTDGEAQTGVESYRVDELYINLYVITRHHHIYALGECNLTGAVHGTKVELRTVVITKCGMTTTLFLLKYIDGSLELRVRSDGTRMGNDHTTLYFLLVDTAEEQTYIITSLSLIEDLTEHLDASYNGLLVLTETKDLYFVTYLYGTSLNTTCCNSTTTCDREHILYRHQEGFINITLRLLNPVVDSVHEFHYLVFPLFYAIECTKCRTADDRSVCFEVISFEELTYFHFYEFKHLLVLDHITLVKEYDDTGNVYLTSEQNVLTSLRHRTIGCSYNKDCAIHLSSTGYHVLYIVSVSRAVYVCVVTLCCLILDMSGIDGDTTLLLLGGVVNLIEGLYFLACTQSLVEHLGDSGGQGCLTMVYVTDSTNVYVRFCAHKIFFSHSFLF